MTCQDLYAPCITASLEFHKAMAEDGGWKVSQNTAQTTSAPNI